jgi:hypothetical protein
LRAGASDPVPELGNRLRKQILQLAMTAQSSFDCCWIDRERISLHPRHLNIDRDVVLPEFSGLARCRQGREGGRHVVQQIWQLRKQFNQISGHFRQITLGCPEPVTTKLKRKVQRLSVLLLEFRADLSNLSFEASKLIKSQWVL